MDINVLKYMKWCFLVSESIILLFYKLLKNNHLSFVEIFMFSTKLVCFAWAWWEVSKEDEEEKRDVN